MEKEQSIEQGESNTSFTTEESTSKSQTSVDKSQKLTTAKRRQNDKFYTKAWMLLALGGIVYLALLYIFIFSIVLSRANCITYGFFSNKLYFSLSICGLLVGLCYLSRKTYPKLAYTLIVFYAVSSVVLPCYSTYFKDTYSPDEKLLKIQAQDLMVSEIETSEPLVALTFDDGPIPGKTEAILDVLKKENIHATFFVIGQRVIGNEAIVRRAYDEGNEIGNHTFSHFITKFASTERVDWEYLHTSEIIKKVTGEAPKYCRAPTGRTNMFYIRRMNEFYKMRPILWTNTTNDFANPDDDICYKNVLKQMPYGAAIFLHHDASSSPRLIERIVHYLKQRGYRFVTISELLENQSK